VLFANKHFSIYFEVLNGLSKGWSKCLLADRFDHHPYSEEELRFLQSSPRRDSLIVGNLVPLNKDGGWKIRWIASPFRLHQMALEPLGRPLFQELARLPWDCTFDEDRGKEVIQNHLKEGKTAFAVDLASATDFFPLGLQIAVLRELFPEPSYVDLFEDLSRGVWRYYQEDGSFLPISWRRGQPMGLFPSFASFALTHGILLDFLSGGKPNSFFIRGDDVVILDRRLYKSYLRMLDMLECPVSIEKCLESSDVTEFANKVVFADKVLPQFKWKRPSEDNFLSMLQAYGQRYSQLLTRRMRRVYNRIHHLLVPWGPEHSFGMNIPYERKVLETLEFEEGIKGEKRREFITGFLRTVYRNCPCDRLESLFYKLSFSYMNKLSRDFDQKSLRAFADLPHELRGVDLSGLTSLFEDYGINQFPDSRTLKYSGRKTLLRRYEEYLSDSAGN
jgi:hypothetical protein